MIPLCYVLCVRDVLLVLVMNIGRRPELVLLSTAVIEVVQETERA